MDKVLVISDDGSTIICCNKSYSGVITVPDGINNIGDNAFENCSLSKIVLPSSLNRIGRRAFSGCTNLVEVRLNEGIVSISSYAFSDCNSLSIINLPLSLRTIGSNNYGEGNAFSGCISLESIEIPEGVSEIPIKTFAGCVNLSSIIIPKTIKDIEFNAFDNCVSLQKIIISDIIRWCYAKKHSYRLTNDPNPLTYSHHLFIDKKTEIVNLELPEKIGFIGAHTFENCTGLKSVCFPDGFVDVGHDAFKGCIGLREITLNSKNVGEILNAFDGCDNVEIINIKHFTPNFCIGLKGFEKLKSVFLINDNGTRTKIDINNIIASKAQEMKIMSIYYHSLDMNLTVVQGRYPNKTSFKAPIVKEGMLLDNLYYSKQDTSVLLKQDWLNASGMGLVLGWNDFRALDFDNFTSYVFGDVDYSQYEMDTHITSCLKRLGLPSDYQWVVWSGSKSGFHIIVRIENFGEKDSAPISYSYMANQKQRIELRWKGHLMLPPSIHNSGYCYEFYRRNVPTSLPQYVKLGDVDKLLDEYCGKNYYKQYNWQERCFELVERQKCNAEDSQGELYFDSNKEKKYNRTKWLESCGTPLSYNSLAIKYLLGNDVPANKDKALEFFKKADNSHAYFNIASLMSIGYFDGSQKQINDYLEKIEIKDLYYPSAFVDDPYPEECIEPKIDRIRKQSAKYIHNITYLFFDTETTGIPIDYKAPSSDTDNWPRLVQLAWILEDEKGNMVNTNNLIISPDGFTIPNDASKVHGITTEIAMKEGIPLDKAINQFIEDFNSARYIVGHNVDFDKKIVGAEMIRLGMKDIMDSKKSYCTMQSSIDFCKIPGKYGYKYPKLQELYKILFGCEFDNAHDAMSDIEATKKCFWELRKRKLI